MDKYKNLKERNNLYSEMICKNFYKTRKSSKAININDFYFVELVVLKSDL